MFAFRMLSLVILWREGMLSLVILWLCELEERYGGDYINQIRIVATALNIWENNNIFLFWCIRIKYIDQIRIVATTSNIWENNDIFLF